MVHYYKHIWGMLTGAAVITVPVTFFLGEEQLIGNQEEFPAPLSALLSLHIHKKKNYIARTLKPKISAGNVLLSKLLRQAKYLSFSTHFGILAYRPNLFFSIHFGSLAYCK